MARHSKFVTAASVVLFTVLVTLLAFALTLFLSIAGLIITSMVRHGAVDLTLAYRYFAPAAAIVAGIVTFVLTTRSEIAAYRRDRRTGGDYSAAA